MTLISSGLLPSAQNVDELRDRFVWQIPERFNIGVAVCDRIARNRPDALALIDVSPDEEAREVTFGELKALTDRFAAGLQQIAQPGDRVAVLLPQSLGTAVSHIGALKAGMVTLPLFTQFGPEALCLRLADSGARVVVTDQDMVARVQQLRPRLPELAHVLDIADLPEPIVSDFVPVDTASEDPAILIYTSGTTGPPKGALHAHRVLLGHLPGVEMSHNLFPQPGDRIWTPADWAWIGGLLDVLLPALYHGVPVVAHRFRKFTGKAAFDLMRTQSVRNAFLPPTALKLMRQVTDQETTPLSLRSVASGGEPLGDALLEWGERLLGATINEFYGQTECNMIVSSCAQLSAPEPAVMGFAVPGHEVQVIDQTGHPLGPGQEGMIAVKRPDPVMFLRYWNRPEATAEKFLGDWLLTGDRGQRTASGRIAFVGREDDVISSAGYRIGPAEIEDCLLGHPAVKLAGVVGVTDDLRGHVVAAFIELADGVDPSRDLAIALSDHVRARLAPYECPRVVTFLPQMPLTATGKIIRRDLRARNLADDQCYDLRDVG